MNRLCVFIFALGAIIFNPIYGQKIEWETQESVSLSELDKPLILFFYQPGDPFSKRLEEQMNSSSMLVNTLDDDFKKVKVDVSKPVTFRGSEYKNGMLLARMFDSSINGVPVLVFMDSYFGNVKVKKGAMDVNSVWANAVATQTDESEASFKQLEVESIKKAESVFNNATFCNNLMKIGQTLDSNPKDIVGEYVSGVFGAKESYSAKIKFEGTSGEVLEDKVIYSLFSSTDSEINEYRFTFDTMISAIKKCGLNSEWNKMDEKKGWYTQPGATGPILQLYYEKGLLGNNFKLVFKMD